MTDPFLYPGIKLQTSATDNFPTEQEIMIKWTGNGAAGRLDTVRQAVQRRPLDVAGL